MAKACIPVDLTNPGQVFACLGFLEAADVLCGNAEGGFDWRDPDNVRFWLAASGGENPITYVLRFLDKASVKSVAPHRSKYNTGEWGIKWDITTVQDSSGMFPFPHPKSPATLPARLEDRDGRRFTIDHWGDKTRRDKVKFWAGSGGYPGTALARDALNLVGCWEDHADDPFALSAEQSSSFRFDWRRDYIPLDAGFSPNAHNKNDMVMQGYPIVELLATMGLAHARPLWKAKLEYSYGVAGIRGDGIYDPIFLRVVLGARQAPFPDLPFRLFTMQLGRQGRESRAYCITNIIEEILPS